MDKQEAPERIFINTQFSKTGYYLTRVTDFETEYIRKDIAESRNKELEEEKLRMAFDKGRSWGETYGGWFIPSKEDHKKHLNACLESIKQLEK